MAKASRDKGKRGELEVVHLARPHFPDAARDWATPQEDGDIKDLIPGLYLEVRRREKLAIPAWCREVEEKAGDRLPVLAFRRNHEPWRAVLPLDQLFELLGATARHTAKQSAAGRSRTFATSGPGWPD